MRNYIEPNLAIWTSKTTKTGVYIGTMPLAQQLYWFKSRLETSNPHVLHTWELEKPILFHRINEATISSLAMAIFERQLHGHLQKSHIHRQQPSGNSFGRWQSYKDHFDDGRRYFSVNEHGVPQTSKSDDGHSGGIDIDETEFLVLVFTIAPTNQSSLQNPKSTKHVEPNRATKQNCF